MNTSSLRGRRCIKTWTILDLFMGPWGHAHCSTAFYRKAGLQFGRSYSGNKTIFMQSNRSSSGSLGRLASCPEDGQNPPAPTGALPRQCYVEVTTSIVEKTIANLIWLHDSNHLINSYNLFNLMPLWPPTSNLHLQGLQSWLLGPCQTRVWRASGIASGGKWNDPPSNGGNGTNQNWMHHQEWWHTHTQYDQGICKPCSAPNL